MDHVHVLTHRAPVTQIVAALIRVAAEQRRRADQLHVLGDPRAELFAEDAQRIDEAIAMLAFPTPPADTS